MSSPVAVCCIVTTKLALRQIIANQNGRASPARPPLSLDAALLMVAPGIRPAGSPEQQQRVNHKAGDCGPEPIISSSVGLLWGADDAVAPPRRSLPLSAQQAAKHRSTLMAKGYWIGRI